MPRILYPSAKIILRGQAIGFSLILLVMWAAELLRLPHHLYDEPAEINWTRLGVRTLVFGLIWLIVHLSTFRLLKRLHELESLLRICGWCRRIKDEDEWKSLEDYFDSRFHTNTSHAICPDCSAKQLASYPVAVRVKPSPAPDRPPNRENSV